ncbi:sugar nucleotide-binding protein [Ramlibacter alkalitolerans]|uniref:dTDP-4-dehydrorhamnose reductase n=1 Tax=Ramlibacter alkalitolerans TaxID=2039631 RepID=A0ABS1JRJ8_9BURK|nr:sugar nucleotide-binding protein [Ramlibacter alkalitolerans]MBL0426884.1 sugar nucleotide-binding protein [Ramlibacter alkalitolerans]
MRRVELWAGAECTFNRVGERFLDQVARSGFSQRLDDLDRLASLGIARMRFPLVWERTETAPGQFDWSWSDPRIARLAELGVAPIAGLLHHGSGPRWTDLLDPEFPRQLARYARSVAERYPQIEAYTPVNEPLTTARFSGLYGIWYPHQADDRSFVRALLNQVHGTVLAMRAVREVNPQAQLVQTEDLGLTTSSAHLRYQADFENLRRWLSFDLLAGRVTPGHGMWGYLRDFGASEQELRALLEEPCPPDIVGINSYVTSERFLDERIALYPPHLVGGNGRDRYADVETVRVSGAFIGGFEARLREACERYGRPTAITEVHIGCSREEQLRWLHQAWVAAEKLRAEGLPVRALTCWAAFGSFDWNSLVTRDDGHYEPGLWDVRSTPPRPTALVKLARQLSSGRAPDHPALDAPGWWQREVRLKHPPLDELRTSPVRGRPLLITGATGTLGQAFARLCEARGLPHQVLRRADLEITDAASVERALKHWQPWAVINTAGYVRVDEAEGDERQWRENAVGPALLAAACARHGARLVTFSSDLVFDGTKETPYVEGDEARPLNAYGRAKREAEQRVLTVAPESLVVRTSAFFGPWDRHNFVTLALAALRRGETWAAAADQIVSPTYVPDLVHATLDLLIDGEQGLWHLANQGALSWAELACTAADLAGLDAGLVQALPGALLAQTARRPAYAALSSERGLVMPTLAHALARYLEETALLARTTHANVEAPVLT